MKTRDLEREARTVDGRLLLRSESLEDDLGYVFKEDLAGVECNVWQGFHLQDLPRVVDPRIRSINLVQRANDMSPIERMDWLEELRLGGAGPIDLSRHERLRTLAIEWAPGLLLPPTLPRLVRLEVWKLSTRDRTLRALPEAPALETLRCVQGNTRTVDGIERFASLRELELSYLRSLAGINALSTLTTLRSLSLINCPNVVDYHVLGELHDLHELRIEGQKRLPSLTFVRRLKRLDFFSLGGSIVLDGDLSPCLGLRHVVVDDRKGYSHTGADLMDAGEAARRSD